MSSLPAWLPIALSACGLAMCLAIYRSMQKSESVSDIVARTKQQSVPPAPPAPSLLPDESEADQKRLKEKLDEAARNIADSVPDDAEFSDFLKGLESRDPKR